MTMSQMPPPPTPPWMQKDPEVKINLPPPPQRKAANMPHPAFNHKSHRGSCCRTCCCCFCIFIAILLLALISVIVFFYFHFDPRIPEITPKAIALDQFNITPGRNNGASLELQSTIVVEIKNPNKRLRMEYDKTQIVLSSNNGNMGTLGQHTVPGFNQGTNNVTTLRVSMKGQKEINSALAQVLRNGYKNHGLNVDVEVRSGIGMKAGGWSTGKIPVMVFCPNVPLDGGGGVRPKCRIKVFNWYVQ